jgi:Reverse transcriptase (RNA-dependent DNA polymerase)
VRFDGTYTAQGEADVLHPLLPEDIVVIDDNADDVDDVTEVTGNAEGSTASSNPQHNQGFATNSEFNVNTLSKTSTTTDKQSDCPRSALNPVHADSNASGSNTTNNTALQPIPRPKGRPRRSVPESAGNPEPLRRSARFIARANMAKADTEANLNVSDPTSYKEAVQHDHWKAAMREEYTSLQLNKTWTLARTNTLQAAGAKPISCKWVYRTKTNPDGTIRYKARLVIRGFEQIEHGETFAPVARLSSLRALLAISPEKDWIVHHMDVTTAFLNPSIGDEVVYILPPPGSEWLDPKTFGASADSTQAAVIRKLQKALYGLKIAPRL